MADPNEFDEVMPDLPEPKPRMPEKIEENMGSRLIHMILIAIMLSFAQTILTLMTVVQFLLTLINSGEPNARIADFGIDLGTWIAKAARYQAMASEERPWPWTPWE
jgi:hypothetical protein